MRSRGDEKRKKTKKRGALFFGLGGFVFFSLVWGVWGGDLPGGLYDCLAGLGLLSERRALVLVIRALASALRRAGLLLRVLGDLDEAVGGSEGLRAEVEHLLLAVEAERAVTGRRPLRLIGVDVDARVRLLVAPAASEDLAARALRLALGHLLAALLRGADALFEEGGVLAGAGDAELHRAVLRAPLVRLLLRGVRHDAVVALLILSSLVRETRLPLCRGLVGQSVGKSVHQLVAPLRDAVKHPVAHLQHHATEQRVLRAVTRAAGGGVLHVLR